MNRSMRVMALAVAAVFVLGACGGGGTTGGRQPSPTATAGTPTPTETATSGETRIAIEDNVFQPNTLTVAAGAELELDNEGENPHTFTIDGQGVDMQVNAGENGRVTLDLDAGTYDFYCRFHRSLGMTGTLTVSG